MSINSCCKYRYKAFCVRHFPLRKVFHGDNVIYIREGDTMAGVWTVTLIGLVIILAVSGGTIFHFLRQALNSEDSTRVDKLPASTDPKHSDKSK